ncbi:MAG: alginate lyase family protein [Anaerolineaceae bacterium]|nr:alginate lyase family protein [Anaerolineaceae bacterium]
MNPLTKAIKTLHDLGFSKVWRYGVYQFGLRTGHYRRATPTGKVEMPGKPGLPPIASYPPVSEAQSDLAQSAADEIVRGKFRPFSGELAPLDLEAGASPLHWADLERTPPEQDIKWVWEPGRFGWAITLARAYAFGGNPAYVRDFWDKTRRFLAAHPSNLGRQWQSGQEVALRLMSLVFCDRVFATAPETTPENRQQLWEAVAAHARRIPPTLIYARSQNNNHLLSEAAGLYTAGLYLPEHPESQRWRKLGWRWLNWGLRNQISEFGTYIQHSVNYHRLMLQLALYTDNIRRSAGEPDWPEETQARLTAATRWLWALTDPENGQTPNLGANDGAYIFPLTHLPYHDFRPVVAAAGKAFLGLDIYDQPGLNEMADWFGLSAPIDPEQTQPQAADMLRVAGGSGRAFLRTAHFTDRPSHADQLHADLWWRGVNVASDPGTFAYNAAPPWDNALATTHVHNTLSLDGRDQMSRAGRFLWLDWAQAEVLAYEVNDEGEIIWLAAEHDGYTNQGALHQRMLESNDNGWTITDNLLPYVLADDMVHEVRLAWLLPDWDWEQISKNEIRLIGEPVSFTMALDGIDNLSLFRSGERLAGTLAPDPAWGWVSPTYGVKKPALCLVARVSGALPLEIHSKFVFSS